MTIREDAEALILRNAYVGEASEYKPLANAADVQAKRVIVLLDTLEGMAQSKQEKFSAVRELAQEAIDKAETIR